MPLGLGFGAGLVLMVASALLFTDSAEWLGRHLGLSHAMTGGFLAALGTALPESVVPVVALVSRGPHADQTAIGSILGAPFMLATLGLGAVSLAALISRRPRLLVEARSARRLLDTFCLSFALLMVGTLLPQPLRYLDAAVLFVLYVYFVRRLMSGEAETAGEGEQLLLPRLVRRSPGPRAGYWLAGLEALLSVVGLVAASELFLGAIDQTAQLVRVAALVLALLLVPIATELPEMLIGTLWVRRRLDALAFGNVAGAMAFQATIPGIVGLCFTSWNPSGLGYLAAVITLAGALVATAATLRGGIDARITAPAGLGLYALYAVVVGLGAR